MIKMAEQQKLTAAEITFFNRAIPYIEQGMSMEEALQAVLSRDQEIADISLAKTRTGEAVRRGLAAQVYYEVRGRDAMARAVHSAADSDLNWR
jgi:hypothetical protein